MVELREAAAAARALVENTGGGLLVDDDPAEVLTDGRVFVFPYVDAAASGVLDGAPLLLVDVASGRARWEVVPVGSGRYPDLEPVAEDESPVKLFG